MSPRPFRLLWLWDYDGTLVVPGPMAFDSLDFAIEAVTPPGWTLTWKEKQDILKATTGTTEQRLVSVLGDRLGYAPDRRGLLLSAFMTARNAFIHSFRRERGGPDDLLFSDTLALLTYSAGRDDILNMLVTGNPRSTMEARMDPRLRPFFERGGRLIGTFGDEADSRQRLLTNAVRLAERDYGFVPKRRADHFLDNVRYTADTTADLVGSVRARIPFIWTSGEGRIDITDGDMELVHLLDRMGPDELSDSEIRRAILPNATTGEFKTVLSPPRVTDGFALWYYGVEGTLDDHMRLSQAMSEQMPGFEIRPMARKEAF